METAQPGNTGRHDLTSAPWRLAHVPENPLDWSGIDDERAVAHVGSAVGAGQLHRLEQSREQYGPDTASLLQRRLWLAKRPGRLGACRQAVESRP
jgi:hypothetical protein